MSEQINKLLKNNFNTFDSFKNGILELEDRGSLNVIYNLELRPEYSKSLNTQIEDTVFIFDSMDKYEEKMRNMGTIIKTYNKENPTSKVLKRELNKKIQISDTLYVSSLQPKIELNIKHGYNFLEYNTQMVNSKSYSVDMMSLIKIYCTMGTSLFEKNVRVGLGKKDLERSFKKVLSKSVFELSKHLSVDEDSIQNMLYVKDSPLLLEEFYLYHNGISAIYSDEIEFQNNKLVFQKPSNFQIVNGAQTISTLTNIYYELKHLVTNPDDIYLVEDLFRKINVMLTVTSSFDEETNYADDISRFKNTQIKIDNLDTFREEASELNEVYHPTFYIIRPGEVKSSQYNVTMLELVKLYVAFKGKPGSSKNLNSSKFSSELNELMKQTKENPSEFRKFMQLALLVKSNWSTLDVEKDDGIFKYGQTYFISHLWSSQVDYSNDDDASYSLYFDYVIFKEIIDFICEQENKEFDLQASKSDVTYDKILDYLERNESTNKKVSKKPLTDKSVDLKEKFDEFNINNGVNSPKSIKHNFIKSLSYEYKIPDSFRTVSFNDNKKLKEYYLLDGRVFNEIAYEYSHYEDDKALSKSIKELKKQVIEKNRTLNLFCFYEDSVDFKFEISILDDDKILKKFNEFFEKLLRAFENQNFNDLPSPKDDLGFHVRPHARDSDDTFMFTDDEMYPKQGIWMNKSLLEEILAKTTK